MKTINSMLGVAIVLLVVQLAPAQTANASRGNAWACDDQSVSPLPFVETSVEGRAKLCAWRSGLMTTMRLKGLTPGNAYTVWWVYFDDPAACTDGAGNFGPELCGIPVNFAGDNPLAVLGRLDSAVPTRHREYFAGQLRDFIPSPGSQVMFLVFGHGPADYADRRHLARQLLTPEDPTIGAPHLGIEGSPFGYPVAVVAYTIP
jgi:hypothetical protein